jgi:predicted nuclease of predicted toxin-antitoxin system
MEILIDECIAKSTTLTLEQVGFKVLNVEDVLNPGVEDDTIFKYASKYKIPIITHDRRFGIIYYLSQLEPPTIIILQVLTPHPEATNQLLSKFLTQFDLYKPENYGRLILISKNSIRVRSKNLVES